MSYYFNLKTLNIGGADYVYAIINTDIALVRPTIINKRLIDLSAVGVNGGFFASDDYNQPPTGMRSISYWKRDPNFYSYNGTQEEQIARKTFVSYPDNFGIYRATYMITSNLNEVLNFYPNARAVIGGNTYNINAWGSIAYYFATFRTVLAWTETNAHMIVSVNRIVNIPTLMDHIEFLGYSPQYSIVLDGSGSTKMRVHNKNYNRIEYYGSNENRYIGNVVRVSGESYI